MNLELLTTVRKESVIVNLDHVVYIGECKDGVIVRFIDGDYVKCLDDVHALLVRLDAVLKR